MLSLAERKTREKRASALRKVAHLPYEILGPVGVDLSAQAWAARVCDAILDADLDALPEAVRKAVES